MVMGTVGDGRRSVTLAISPGICKPRPTTPAPKSRPAIHDAAIVLRRTCRFGFTCPTAAPTMLPSRHQHPRAGIVGESGSSAPTARLAGPLCLLGALCSGEPERGWDLDRTPRFDQ